MVAPISGMPSPDTRLAPSLAAFKIRAVQVGLLGEVGDAVALDGKLRQRGTQLPGELPRLPVSHRAREAGPPSTTCGCSEGQSCMVPVSDGRPSAV